MRSLLLTLLFLISPTLYAADWKNTLATALHNGGGYVVDAQGRTLFSHRINDSFMPASTIKVATSACALDKLGENYHFKTEFYNLPGNILGVKGYGDPHLVSEELLLIAQELKNRGFKEVRGFLLDASYFDNPIVIDGSSQSSNPYDALNTALLANFNTINVRKLKNGTIISAEAQTPLTPIAIEMAKKSPANGRVNLAQDRTRSIKYVGELLAQFLKKESVLVSGTIQLGNIPENSELLYTHYNSRNLAEVIRGLLEFSTNLTANQLFLTMGAEVYGAPATVAKGAQVLNEFLQNKVQWKNFKVVEGSGLSRQNRVSPAQMMQLLDYFAPHRDLLPLHDLVFRAKTGTLTGANTYMGYFFLKGEWVQFVFLVNSPVPFDYKFKLAKDVYRYLQ